MRLRRFARLFQFDPLHPGTEIQRAAMVKALTYEVGTDWDRLNHRLAGAVKIDAPYVLIGFWPDMFVPATSGPRGINFNDKIDESGIAWFAPHEVGHLIEHYILTEDGRRWFMEQIGATDWGMVTQEIFADAMRDWRKGSWQGLNQFLLPGGE